jgi:REP element-mobilizing transposase RayT
MNTFKLWLKVWIIAGRIKGMEIYTWCIMPSHVHLIFRAKENNPGDVLRSLKTFTSKKLQDLIEEHNQESRKEWLIWMFKRAGLKNSNVKSGQFWQQNNKPIELWSVGVVSESKLYS